jgi:hypothetical protein
MKRTITAVALAAVLVGCSGNQPNRSTPAGSAATFPNEGIPTTTRAKIGVARLRVGQTADLSVVQVPVGQTGAEAPKLVANAAGRKTIARMAVTRVKTSNGDQYNTPERGHYLGVYVKLLSLVDGLAAKTNGTVYVAMRGHRYDPTFGVGFTPGYDFTDLNAGEATEGWLEFDVPAVHGDVILSDTFEGTKVAVWTF